MENKKYVKVGSVLNITREDGEKYKTVKLGQDGSKKPEYDYTVQIRVLNNAGEVVYKASNPWINIVSPHPNAPESILNELQIVVKAE
jgi:hypothetical protein